MHTPWGEAETTTPITDGILSVATSTGGGFKLDSQRNAHMPAYMREKDGWYEEEVAYSCVVTVYAHFFSPESQEIAKDIFRNYYPDAYEKFYNVTLLPGESVLRDKQNFLKANHDKLIASVGLPAGDSTVRVWAYLGGTLAPCREFLVEKGEFDQKGRFGFIVDPNKHVEVAHVIH